jgi:hypothetical protein
MSSCQSGFYRRYGEPKLVANVTNGQPSRLDGELLIHVRVRFVGVVCKASSWPNRERQCRLTGARLSVLSMETCKCIFQSSRSALANDVFVGAKSRATTAFDTRFSHFPIEQIERRVE